MNDQADKQNDQVEPLLRRWGAQEASKQSEVPGLQFQVPARVGPWAVAWRWSPLLAAYIVLAVAVVLFIRRPNQPNISDDGSLQAKLTQLTNDLEGNRAALAEARGELNAQKQRFEEEIAQLTQAFEADKETDKA